MYSIDFDFIPAHQGLAKDPRSSFISACKLFNREHYQKAKEVYFSILKWFQCHARERESRALLLISTILNLGDIFNRTGHSSQAQTMMRHILQWDLTAEQKAIAKVILGEALIQMDQPSAASQYFSEALTDHPLYAMWRIALYYVNHGHHLQRAQSYAGRLVAESRDKFLQSRGYLLLARIHKLRGEIRQAHNLIAQAYFLAPGDTEVQKEIERLKVPAELLQAAQEKPAAVSPPAPPTARTVRPNGNNSAPSSPPSRATPKKRIRKRTKHKKRKDSKEAQDQAEIQAGYELLEDYLAELLMEQEEQEEEENVSVLHASQLGEISYGISSDDREQLARGGIFFEQTLVKLLAQVGLLIPELALEAIEQARTNHSSLLAILFADHYISTEEYLEGLSQIFNIDIFDDETLQSAPQFSQLLRKISLPICRKYQCLPLREMGKTLVIATANPFAKQLQEFEVVVGKRLKCLLSTPLLISKVLAQPPLESLASNALAEPSRGRTSKRTVACAGSAAVNSSPPARHTTSRTSYQSKENMSEDILAAKVFSALQGTPAVKTTVNPAVEPILVVSSKQHQSLEVQVPEGLLTVGRDECNDLVLPDPLLSKRHFCVERHGEHCFIEDLDSSNGTWLNGSRLQGRVPLAYGDQVRAGQHWFFFLTKEWGGRESFMPLALAFVSLPPDKSYLPVWEVIHQTLARLSISSIQPETKFYSQHFDLQLDHSIDYADFVIADISGNPLDPKVAFELGIACALQKPLVIIAQHMPSLPSDLHHPVYRYTLTAVQCLSRTLEEALKKLLSSRA